MLQQWNNIFYLRDTRIDVSQGNYSAFLQSTQVLSHCAHLAESQHSLSQALSHSLSQAVSHDFSQPAHSVHSVHSVAALLLLLQAQDAAATIAATTAIDIKIFFMVTKNKGLNKTLFGKYRTYILKSQYFFV